MKISANDIFSGENIILHGNLTTTHPLSSYGQPVLLIAEWNNEPMSLINWSMAGCQVIEATEQEAQDFERWSSMLL